MRRPLLIAPAVLLAFSLAGCTGGGQASPAANPAPAPPASSSANAADRVLAQAEEGQDLGNGRPTVSYDGLMVRRRVVIAVHTALDADVAGIRKRLDAAAAARGTALSAVSPDVLEPAVLQQMVPEVIVTLPSTATPDDGRTIVRAVTEEDTGKLGVKNFYVLPVLVHDLRFNVATADPAAVSAAVDREGIVSDALGNYSTSGAGRTAQHQLHGPPDRRRNCRECPRGHQPAGAHSRRRRERRAQVRVRNRRGHGRRTAVGRGAARRPGNTPAHGVIRRRQ